MNPINQNSDRLRRLACIFTASTDRNIVTTSDLDEVRRRIQHNNRGTVGRTVRAVLADFYTELDSKYRSEYLFKNALLNQELLSKHSLSTTTVLDEFRLAGSIADFVLLNGEIRAFEIKTDLDNLSKLDKQIQDYRKVANKIFLVVSEENARRLIPRYQDSPLGIIGYSTRTRLTTYKDAEDDRSGLEHTALFKTLRKGEYVDLVTRYTGQFPQVPNTLLFRECLSIAKCMSTSELQAEVREILKRRSLNCPELLTSNRTPTTLRHLCYTLNLTESEYDRLHQFLRTPA